MAEDLRLERERSDGLLQNLTQLQQMVKDLETLRGPSKLVSMVKDAAKTAKQLSEVTQKLKDTQAKWQHEHQLLESSQRKNESVYFSSDFCIVILLTRRDRTRLGTRTTSWWQGSFCSSRSNSNS